MRHEQIADTLSYRKVEVAAWPAIPALSPAPIPEAEQESAAAPFVPTPAAPDVPAGAGVMLIASYGTLLGSFALLTAGSATSIFAIAICAFFMAVFFAVPRIFFAIEPNSGRRVTLEQFLATGMETLTGHSGGGAALVQMLMVPVLLTFGILLIGIGQAFYP